MYMTLWLNYNVMDVVNVELVFYLVSISDRLVGLVAKASALRTKDPRFESRLRWDFSRLSHTSDFKIDTPVATLPGVWHYRVSAGPGQPAVSIL